MTTVPSRRARAGSAWRLPSIPWGSRCGRCRCRSSGARPTGLVERRKQGWDGITFTDSQNLCPDPFVVFATVAEGTERIQLATGVTNVHTRHPAALATAAATVNEISGGRFVLGTGRGDTALFHLGLPPMPIAEFFERTTRLQTYLSGGTIDIDGRESRIRWLDSAKAGKVPLDIAASGPKVIDFSARTAERITFALGADPDRVAWGIALARAAAADAGQRSRPTSRSAPTSASAAIPTSTRRGRWCTAASPRSPTSRRCPARPEPGWPATTRTSSPRSAAATTATSTSATTPPTPPRSPDEFIDRFAVTGTPDRVVERLQELSALGIDRFVVTGPGFGADRDDARLATELLTTEVLPALATVLTSSPGDVDRPGAVGTGTSTSRSQVRAGERRDTWIGRRSGPRGSRSGSVTFTALDSLTLDVGRRRGVRIPRPERRRQVDHAATAARAHQADRRPSRDQRASTWRGRRRCTITSRTCPATSASGRGSPARSASRCSLDSRAASTRPTGAS